MLLTDRELPDTSRRVDGQAVALGQLTGAFGDRPPAEAPRTTEGQVLGHGQVIQELGWDGDVDEDLRQALMDRIDADLVEEAVEAVDAVLLWWRAEDGEVADGLVDELHLLLYPVVLGEGRRLFPEGTPRIPLAMAGQERFDNGVLHLTYSPSPAQA